MRLSQARSHPERYHMLQNQGRTFEIWENNDTKKKKREKANQWKPREKAPQNQVCTKRETCFYMFFHVLRLWNTLFLVSAPAVCDCRLSYGAEFLHLLNSSFGLTRNYQFNIYQLSVDPCWSFPPKHQKFWFSTHRDSHTWSHLCRDTKPCFTQMS